MNQRQKIAYDQQQIVNYRRSRQPKPPLPNPHQTPPHGWKCPRIQTRAHKNRLRCRIQAPMPNPRPGIPTQKICTPQAPHSNKVRKPPPATVSKFPMLPAPLTAAESTPHDSAWAGMFPLLNLHGRIRSDPESGIQHDWNSCTRIQPARPNASGTLTMLIPSHTAGSAPCD